MRPSVPDHGQASAKWGESPLAIVVKSDDSLTEQEVLSHCNGKLARFKLPKAFLFKREIVRSPSGKADYRWAKTQVEPGPGGA